MRPEAGTVSRIAPPFRCRIGFHKWVRLRESDPDLENPDANVRWRTVCRYCGREQGSGHFLPVAVAGAATLAGILLLLLGPPLLGAIFVIGGMGGLTVSLLPAVTERIALWLSR